MKFDIIAEDARGRDVLLVEVKTRPLNDDMAWQYFKYMRGAQLPARFGMVVDPNVIRIFDYENGQDGEFTLVLDAEPIFRHYVPDFASKGRIFHFYLTSIIDYWLRDFSYHWHSADPPESERIDAIGLLPLLKWGMTRFEVVVETDPVP